MKMVRFLIDAIFQRDYPVVQDVYMLITLSMLLGHLLVDVAYVSLNLHVRYQSVVGLMARGAIARKGCL
jgi:ABC-type dipeptide/oligopeptide/nickel transport system permease component